MADFGTSSHLEHDDCVSPNAGDAIEPVTTPEVCSGSPDAISPIGQGANNIMLMEDDGTPIFDIARWSTFGDSIDTSLFASSTGDVFNLSSTIFDGVELHNALPLTTEADAAIGANGSLEKPQEALEQPDTISFNQEADLDRISSSPQVTARSGYSALGQSQEPISLSAELTDIPSILIQTYFTVVCPRFSTFDSRQNLFRSFVDESWQHSSAMFYTMLSMAAGKLGFQESHMKKSALKYQTLALQELSASVSNASSWNTELLIIVLMLGLSACWHNIQDLGLPHLKALHEATQNDTFDVADGISMREFFRDALIYWEMVTCYMNKATPFYDLDTLPDLAPEKNPGRFRLITPHPWTSVASTQQTMFTRVANLIKQVRLFDGAAASSSPCRLAQPKEFLETLHQLEKELWDLKLPSLHEIANTGDENTPAVHHLLIAEAYTLANFYQLYSVFPNLRRSRAKLITNQTTTSFSGRRSWAEDQSALWGSILLEDRGTEDWLNFLGRNIITRVEQIQLGSGTSCLHPLLLLIGSTALSIDPEKQGSAEEREILRMRDFVLNRLDTASVYYMSDRIRCARMAVVEIFKRLDVGVPVLWMDVLQSMGIFTVIG